MNASIAPLALVAITEHHLRRPVDQEHVVGALLGDVSDDGQHVTIQDAFALPQNEEKQTSDHLTSMLQLHARAGRRDQVVGWYTTSTQQKDEDVASLFLRAESSSPLVQLRLNASFPDNEWVQVSSMSSSPGQAMESTVIPHRLAEVPVEERVALNLMRQSIGQTEGVSVPSRVQTVQHLLTQARQHSARLQLYQQEVANGKRKPIPALDHMIQEIQNSVPQVDPTTFEQRFEATTQDLLMVAYLSSMTRAQLALAERLLYQ